jgi:hydroxymethylglutaryl-CoA reductase
MEESAGRTASGFYKLTAAERLETVRQSANLDPEETSVLRESLDIAERTGTNWLENQVGAVVLPLAVVPGFTVNGKSYIVPLATEETGIVAACSFAAKAAARYGGFTARMESDLVSGQVIIDQCPHPEEAVRKIESAAFDVMQQVNRKHPHLAAAGGGLREIEARTVKFRDKPRFVAVTITADSRDAMGAALMTTMAEETAEILGPLLGGQVLLRVITNDMSARVCEARACFDITDTGGLDVCKRIVQAAEYARLDLSRAVTHNKGILNGMSAFAMATGNDTRAVEAAAHFFASVSGTYQPLSDWKLTDDWLEGVIWVPGAVGSVGGATQATRLNRLSYKILGTSSGTTVREICAAVGLAANLGVLRALVTTGIGKSHRNKS